MSPKVDANLPAPAELDAELATLGAAVQAMDHGAPLDRSYASLDRVEDYLGTALDATQGEARELLVRRVEWYVGSTLIHNARGVWAIREDIAGRPRPHVIKLPELGRYGFLPALVVNPFVRARQPRVLRDWTEVYDIPYRRKIGDELLAAAAHELAMFADDVKQLTGTSSRLELDLASLDLVEDALARLIAAEPTRIRVRQVQARAVLHVGEVFRTEVEPAEWALCTQPESDAIGQLSVDGFAPMVVLRYISSTTRPGALRESVNDEIDARR